MVLNNLLHITDSHLTKENARTRLQDEVFCAEIYTNRLNRHSVVHSHPYHELVLPLSGSDVIYSVDGGLYRVQLGELAFFPAETYHSGQFCVNRQESERLVIQIARSLWEQAAQRTKAPVQKTLQHFLILSEGKETTADLIGLINRAARSNGSTNNIQSEVLIILITEIQLLMTQMLGIDRQAVPTMVHPLAARATLYLQEHFRETDLTVEKLARTLFTSREHLSRLFKESTMESVHGYLTGLRMQQARKLLSEGSSVLTAGNESGFANYNSFLKAYRRLYGTTPTSFRTKAICRSTKEKSKAAKIPEKG